MPGHLLYSSRLRGGRSRTAVCTQERTQKLLGSRRRNSRTRELKDLAPVQGQRPGRWLWSDLAVEG